MGINPDWGKKYARGGYAEPATAYHSLTGSWRTQRPQYRETPAPCQVACPAGENPQAYLAEVTRGAERRAWETLVRSNPLPAITGRVCPHPCEQSCNRASYDVAVSIHQVERYLGDAALEQDWPYPVVKEVSSDSPRIAVVGSGPAGLSCAWQLVRSGCQVVMFEAESRPGGTCASAIPPYRLPLSVVRGETERLLSLKGIEFRARQRLGRDFSLEELQSEFAATFLGVGAQRPRMWSVDGVQPGDLRAGLDLLKEWLSLGQIPIGSRVAVIGGGNTAVDLARVLKRAGSSQVFLITHDSLPGPEPDAMPALAREVQHAQQEGVDLLTHRGVTRLVMKDGRVGGLELVHMEKIAEEAGRVRRVPFEGTEELLAVDMVVPATGEEVDPIGVEALLGSKMYLETDASGALPGRSTYTGGDATPSGGTVTAAIGAGAQAARSILSGLRGEKPKLPRTPTPLPVERLNLAYFELTPGTVPELVPIEERNANREIDPGLGKSEVAFEARRCFSCGQCLECDNCFTLCPDASVLKSLMVQNTGAHYVFDYDYCKGCGLCAEECPTGFIKMVPER